MTEPRFGSYRVLSELDSGVATTISRARHESLARDVVVKHLKDVVPIGSAFANALEREAEILAELAHPNIVALYDFVRSDRAIGLVLEHVEGFRLGEVREAAGGHLAEAEVEAIGAALADALSHAHARGVVHLDVKPGNVLLGRNGELKLVDFGAAAYAGETSARAASGEGELAFGTPAYLAPEQLFGAEADPKSDVFSLGVVLYELASGEKPFDGKGPRAEIVPLERRAPSVGHALAALVDRALERLPADRPTAEELATGLRDLAPRVSTERAVRSLLARVRLAPGTAPPPPLHPKPSSDRGRSWRVDSRLTMALAAAVATLLAILIVLAFVRRESKVAAAPAEVGELRVLASPWAEVWIDGKLVETTPFARALVLQAGTHHVVLRHPDAPDEVRDVRIAASAPALVDVTMAIREAAAEERDR